MTFLNYTWQELIPATLWALSVTGLAWGLGRMLLLKKTLAVKAAHSASHITRRLPPLLRWLLPWTLYPAFFFHRSQFQNLCARLERRVITAGYDGAITPQEYLALCFLVPLVWGIGLALTTIGVFALAGGNVTARPIFLALALLIWMALYPRLWLNSAIKARHHAILRALPFVMDLLTISVEAGLDFMAAIRSIIERRRPDALGEELGRALFEIQLGKTRREALRHMATRVDQPDMHSLITALTQADEMGVSIGAVLRVQADQIRTKRFLRAEKLAHEAPVKMLFPLIAFIFPAVFLILLGPMILHVLRYGI